MEVLEDSGGAQRDIKELFNCKSGIESAKSTERRKYTVRLRELLELPHIVDYLISCSNEESQRGRPRSSNGVSGGISWAGLWRSVLVYVKKETEAISKLEEKGTGTTSAFTSRQTKKKDVAETVRTFCKAGNRKGHHLPAGEMIDHFLSVLGNSQLGVWLGKDYSQILLQHIITHPHYVLHMSAHTWEELTSAYCAIFLSPPSSSFDRALLSKVIHMLVTQWLSQSDLPIPKLYTFFRQAFANIGDNSKVWEHLLAALVSFSSVAVNARGRLCSLGEDIFLTCLHQWSRCAPAVKDLLTEFFRIQLIVHHPRGSHTDEEGAWAANDTKWQSHMEKLYDQLITDLETTTSNCRLSWGRESSIKFELLDLMVDVFNQVFWIRSQTTFDPSHHRAKRRKATSGWSVIRDGLHSTSDSTAAAIWLKLVAWFVFKWPKSLHPPDHASLLSSLAQMLRESKRATCVRWVLVCLQALALHPSASSSSSTSLTLSPSSTTILSSSSSIPSLQPSSSLLSPTSGCGGGSEQLWQKIWNSTIKMLCVRTAEEEGYNLLTVLLEMGVVNIDHDPWKLLLTALQQPGSCMVRFLAALLACRPLPETLHFDLPLPMTLPGLTQTTQSSSSPPCSSLYPLRSQLLNLLLPTNSALMESQETMKFVHLSNMSTSTPVSLLAAILIALTQRSCGSAQVPSLKSFYLCSNSRDYLQGILRASSAPPISLAASKRKEGEEGEEWSREDVWGDIERVYLQSTFDLPLSTSCPHTTTKSELTLSRETTITELQTLLLKLLSERSQLLLQPPTFEPSVTSRERVQALASLVVGVAHHTALIVNSLLLLCHCEAFPSVEQLRRTLAVRALPNLLKRFVSLLRDPLWNEMESASYYQSATTGLEMLSQLLCFPHVEGGGFTLSSSVAKALRVVKKLCCLSMPNELIELVTSLAQGKWPIVTPSASGTFSLCGTSSTSTSRGPSLTRDSQSSSNFDDDMDIGESNMSTQADPSATNLATPADVLSNSSLNDKSVCQIKAAKFLSHTYLCLFSCSHGDGDVPDTGDEGGVASKVQGTLLLLLEDLSGSLHVQLIFGILQTFADSAHPLDSGILKSLVSSLGPLLRLHRNNQTVYSCGLKMLTQLVSHLSKAPPEVDNDSVKRSSRSLLSAFWTLYKDQRLCSAVRIELARLIQVMLEADRGGRWAWIEATRKRRSPKEGGAGDKTTRLKDAMISLLNDADHRVRMHMATAVTSLFFCGGCEESHDSQVTLLPRKDQENVYDKILAMLQDANQVMADQDQLSVEDDSVNRVASMITTLLHVACVSPVSERNVASLLINAVGQIDHDLVAKALSLLATYLGYSSRRQFLNDMLVSLVRKWVEQHHPLIEFPTKLLEFETPKEFFSAYSCQVVPLLVAKCDEATLNTLAKDVLATPLSDLLRESLPACMVLILSTYSEQRWEAGEGGEPVAVSEEEKKTALNSHNLLTQILSEEVISQTIQNSIDEFVVELLVRMFELPTADSHLARFCLNSDPEPCRPHYSSHSVRATLDYLPSCYGNSAMGNSFIRLLSRKKDNIQKILLSLAVKIDSTHRCFIKRRLLLSYNLFVKLVCRELHDGLDKTQSFVVMDTIHTVSRVLSGITATSSNLIGQLFPLCCDVLETLCRAVVTACPHELENHLQTVVACLVPFAGENSPHGKQSLSLLTYLLQAADPDYVTQLDPFPESVPLPSELRQQMGGATNLLSEIDRFLSVGVYSSRTEGLRALGTLLHKSRFEISSLIEKGCHGDSAILRLVQGLLSLCRGPECTRGMRSEVARCLGEVGPVDFRCIALSSHNHHNTFDVSSLPSNWSPPHVYTAKLLYQLTMMLMDKSITVVRASSECLRAVLATKTGAFVLTKLEEISSETSEWFLYLEPFKPQRRKRAASASSVAPPTATPTIIDACDLWVPSGGVSHCQWLTRLVTSIIDSDAVEDEVLKATRNVCSVKVEFCEEVFPLLVYDLLCSRSGEWRRIISLQLRLFFATVDSTSSRPSTPSIANHTPSITPITPDSIRTILNMIMYLRTVDRPTNSRGSGTQWDNNFWLDLDFLAVAKAAHVCSAHFTSLLFTEIWHGAKGQQSINNDVMEIEPGEQSRVLESSDIQKMLLQAYSQIGEPDSLYGACSAHAADEMTRVHLYEHEKEWSKSLSACDLQMLLPGATSESTLAESLRQLGLYHVLNMYLCGVKSVKGEGVRDVSEYQYEAAWRCAQWEEGAIMTSSSSGLGGYHQTLYGCLTSLKDGEANLVNTFVTDARGHVTSSLLSTGLESTYALYPLLSQLLCLLEVEEAGSILTSSCPTERISSLVKDWKDRLPLLNSDFQFVEPVLAARCSLLYCLLQNAAAEVKGQVTPPVELRRKVDHLFEALSDSLQTRVKFAREAGSYQVCEGALFALSRHVSQLGCYGVAESLHPSLPWTLKLEEAKLNWERKDTTLAMALLKSLLTKLTKLIDPAPSVKALYPPALCLYGSWLAETRSENPSVIMKNYLEKSVELMEDLHSNNDLTAVVGAYLTLARYADSQYQRINRQMKSSSFEAKKQLLSKTKKDIKRLEDELSVDARNRNRHYRTLVAQSGEDEIAMTSLLTDKDSFLCKALENYMLCLRAGDKYDLRVFRLCSLWFANSAHQEVNKLIEKGSNLLESRKFLPLMYQLAARMSARQTRSQFQTILQKIIFRTTVDHPHHCLYVILALSNASKDNVYPMSGHVTGTRNTGRSGRLSKKQSFSGSVDEDKVKAAGDMIRKLRSEKLTLVQSVEKLCEAFIDLAYHDVTAFKKERGPVKLPSTCLLLKLHKLEMVAVPTVEIPVDPTCRYDNIISIDGFDSFFQLAGGVNLPKVMSCLGSDGKRRRQLVKGRDDLRQDAVMQQVFVLVNRLLQKDPSTMKRRLCVRTYKVIPLSQRSGIVEWCEGTLPLGEYLIGSPQNPYTGAHCRYQPNDWLSFDCRKRLTTAKTQKAKMYGEICRHFKPVFHHFFMEKFTSPPQWFERRLTYTRSVAASSIVGYIVGLGDRHVQNILIDTNSAELIHIDLGVAFEQGKTLPTPETVPFRLTRDLVDGMGLTGVEGVFRQCCEKTMFLMRTYHEELRTILEVLLYDPLYQWTLSPLKAMHLQRRQEPAEESTTFFDGDNGTSSTAPSNGQEDSTNKMAERVLLRLQEKLEGIEDGVPLSIHGQVNHLIQEATDPANLCLLFPGWQPWI